MSTNLTALCKNIAKLPRRTKQLILISTDCILLLFSAYLAFAIRFSFFFQPNHSQLFLIFLVPAIALPVFIKYGLYRAIIRYLPERAIWSIFQASSAVALLWVTVIFLTELNGGRGAPRSVPLLYWLISTVLITSSRFSAKWILQRTTDNHNDYVKALIIGSGAAARQLATALRSHGRTRVYGFIDSNPATVGMDIIGLRVYAPDLIPSLIDNYGIDQVIISDPNLSAEERRQYANILGRQTVKTRILPPIADLSAGKYLISALRNVEIDDLLGRSPVPPDQALLSEVVQGKTIMVTGAGGSIGRELCQAIVNLSPKRLVLFEVSEFALYEAERHLQALNLCEIIPVLGTVLDRAEVEKTIRDHAVNIVYHCAAYKHVPLVEKNPIIGVRNNVIGTVNIAQAAVAAKVDRLVLISSDKAVRPTNIMGATKRWAELIIYQYGEIARISNPKSSFYSVRFGNVLGSNGSVVPLFREQISRGGPVTLTHEKMTRYFMSIKEAAELILQSGGVAQTGDTILLEMGDPIRIRDLAENMILLAGLTLKDTNNPQGDIAIEVTGIRPGEKMFEELFYDPQLVQVTRHPKIMRSPRGQKANIDIYEALDRLNSAIASNDHETLREVLFSIIPYDDCEDGVIIN
ncbi:polysaccharide biosynthesis protein [Paenochrobactrum gallinarii]|uniref:polysaccharide biosynthesis protein n=1 Tax=Paenochrobactrum gallinarii TaxID=643673 RepID=UPI001AEED53C|nr:nucleoside-diphosphate sugar epimerase/dehydratase [Paenochrobactrum gallinarii]